MDLGTTTFFLEGPGPPLSNFEFCLINLNNTVSIGSIAKVNRLTKKFCQYCGIIICNLAVNRAGFRKCLAEHTAHNLVAFLVNAYHMVLSNSVARWCNFACLCVRKISCHTIEKLL